MYFACKCCNSLGLYCKLVRLTAIESVSQSTAMGLTQSQSTTLKQSDDQSTIRHLHGRSLHLYFLVRYSVMCTKSESIDLTQ